MSLITRSSFLFGFVISDTNFQISYKEVTNELIANLNIGDYTPEALSLEIARAMTESSESSLLYTVSFDRVTRLFTISTTSNFDLLVATSSTLGTTAFNLIGFTGSDLTGQMSYTGNNTSGTIYKPQFLLQKYIPKEDNQRAVDATVNESASGKIEIVTFGEVQEIEFSIDNITDIFQPYGSPIENDASALTNIRNFLKAVSKKTIFQFMPDRDDTNTFINVIVEKLGSSSKGAGFRLIEQFNRNLPNYYNTELFILRVIT